jgi:hypothetical protein
MAATPPTTLFFITSLFSLAFKLPADWLEVSAKKVVKETHRLELCYKWSCINVQTANFLGDILAERRAFTFNQTYYLQP